MDLLPELLPLVSLMKTSTFRLRKPDPVLSINALGSASGSVAKLGPDLQRIRAISTQVRPKPTTPCSEKACSRIERVRSCDSIECSRISLSSPGYNANCPWHTLHIACKAGTELRNESRTRHQQSQINIFDPYNALQRLTTRLRTESL